MNDNFTASLLAKRKNLSDLNTEVEEIYQAIKTRIQECESINQSELLFDLPVHFSIANLELNDLQLVIYTRLIEIIKNKGFDVFFVKKDKNCSLLIKWTSALGEAEKEKMKELLIAHIPKPEDIKKSTILKNMFPNDPPAQIRHPEPRRVVMPEIIPRPPAPPPNQQNMPSLSNLEPNWVPVTPRKEYYY